MRNPWLRRVHAAMLAEGLVLTSDEIKTLFGRPQGAVAVSKLLDDSEAFEAVARGRYRAVDRLAQRPPKWLTLDRMGQVPSVFHLR